MTKSDVGARFIAPNVRVSLTENGGTFSNLLAQQKRLAFSTVVDYLDQLSEAIDLAHEQGFIHRNLNPSTILLTDEGHLVILGLRTAGVGALSGAKRSASQSFAPSRETRGTSHDNNRLMRLAYMAPEQILTGSILSPEARHLSNISGMDRTVDGRADLYSLGAILYQMVTGVLPFQAEALEQIALQHLRMPPPSPRQFRPDLPIAAEQTMLRALAKRPADRYVRAQDLAMAFSVALMAAGVLRIEPTDTDGRHASAVPPSEPANSAAVSRTNVILSASEGSGPVSRNNVILSASEGSKRLAQGPLQTDAAPSFPTTSQPHSRPYNEQPGSEFRHHSKVGGGVDEGSEPFDRLVPTNDNDLDEDQPTNPIPVVNVAPSSPANLATQEPSRITPVGADVSNPTPMYRPPEPGYNPTSPLPATSTTDTLSLSNLQQGNTGTLKLTGPAKIVQVPVAGQPGLYVTGLLPIFPPQPTPGTTAAPSREGANSTGQLDRAPETGWRSAFQSFLPIRNVSAKARTILTLALVVMLVICASGLFWLIHTHSVGTRFIASVTATPDVKATATAQAIAKATANDILIDPLGQNIHNWPIVKTGPMTFVFEDNAYHIADNAPSRSASAILPDETLHDPFAYTLTMQEVRGNDASINNEFGMIIRANSQNKNGKTIITFYSFEVLNTKNGEYQFWKYDNSVGSNTSPWTKLWHQPFGKEFHQGHGPGSTNTFKIFANGKSFTLIVNGKQIATIQDTSCKGCPCTCSGGIGMLVNLQGTEVAFSNLRLTHS